MPLTEFCAFENEEEREAVLEFQQKILKSGKEDEKVELKWVRKKN